jgi:superfamily I DNA/RNA helicase
MQWSNFRPLLKDSLDSGRSNLIVGDVKQSIYRFRNSDWTLLDRQVKEDFPRQINEKKLDVNWRSCRHIVEFNNMLFSAVPLILQQSYNDETERSFLPENEKNEYRLRIVSAYKDAFQHVAKPFATKDGHVHVRFLTDTENKKWQEAALEQLPLTIEKLQDNGYDLRDIAILTRTGKEGLQVAETLLGYRETHPESGYKYDIITEDSLTIHSSLSVRWLTAMLRYLNQPDNGSNYRMALILYAILRRKQASLRKAPPVRKAPQEHPPGIQEASGSQQVLSCGTDRDLFRPFPAETMNVLRKLANRPLYELAEGVFRLFENDIPENEIVFIQAFLDSVAEYAANETADTGQFISWWNETGYRKKITTPDSRNAIRIMTIHKSKGLGFKAVIIPFAEWKTDQKEAILWCRTGQKPFDKLSLIPVKYGPILKNTFFASDYFHEKLHAYMDNLNTLYVAFTRAKEELIVMAPHPKSETTTISRLLWEGVHSDADYPFDTEGELYERGTWWRTETGRTPSPVEEVPVTRFRSVSPDRRLQLRLQRKGGFLREDKRKYGLLMHDILSRIERYDDIIPAISEKYASGEINREEYHTLEKKLTALTGRDEVRRWFDGSMHVMNETEILSAGGASQRPDRIMIDNSQRVIVVDYKAGEQKEKHHIRQIGKYMSLIRDMGYPDVEGYLWYISPDDIEKCIYSVSACNPVI